MSNIFSIYCILSVDHLKKENLVISSSKDGLKFPIYKIQYPRMLHNEMRYNMQSMLMPNTYNIDLIKNISFSYIDIQNELILHYIEKNYNEDVDVNKDVFIFSSTILDKIYPLNGLYWYKFDFVKSLTDMDLDNSIIDFVVQKSIL